MIVKKIRRSAAAVLSVIIAANGIAASAQGSNSPPDLPSCTIDIPFSVHDNKGWIPEGTVFEVELTADGNAPLPEKTVYEVNVIGKFKFGPIVFDEPGDYEYTIREITYDSDKIVFDETIYNVHAAVLWDDSGGLICGYSVTADGKALKPESLDFDNDYISPPEDSSYSDSKDPVTDDSDGQVVVGDMSSSQEDTSAGESSNDSSKNSVNSYADSRYSSESSSKSTVPWNSLLPPNTGGAVTLGFSGAGFIGFALVLLSRRRNEDEDEPPNDREGGQNWTKQ